MLEVAAEARARQIDLADQQRVAGGLARSAASASPISRPVDRMHVLERRVLLRQRQPERVARRRVVAKLGVLGEPVDGIDAKAVDSALEPEAHDLPIASRTSGLRQSRSGCSG